jgi:hypothetical protein
MEAEAGHFNPERRSGSSAEVGGMAVPVLPGALWRKPCASQTQSWRRAVRARADVSQRAPTSQIPGWMADAGLISLAPRLRGLENVEKSAEGDNEGNLLKN